MILVSSDCAKRVLEWVITCGFGICRGCDIVPVAVVRGAVDVSHLWVNNGTHCYEALKHVFYSLDLSAMVSLVFRLC